MKRNAYGFNPSVGYLPTWSHKVDHGSRRKHGELCGVLNYIINHFNGVNLPVWQMTDPKHMGLVLCVPSLLLAVHPPQLWRPS